MSDLLRLKFSATDRYAHTSCLEVSFIPISNDELSIGISATVSTLHSSAMPLEFTACTICYGFDLAEFARELEQLHASYDGSAEFVNQLGSLELHLTLSDKARGILSVEASYEHDPLGMSPVKFRCFRLEQTYLPSLLLDIRRFLEDSGVSTVHPFVHAPSDKDAP